MSCRHVGDIASVGSAESRKGAKREFLDRTKSYQVKRDKVGGRTHCRLGEEEGGGGRRRGCGAPGWAVSQATAIHPRLGGKSEGQRAHRSASKGGAISSAAEAVVVMRGAPTCGQRGDQE